MSCWGTDMWLVGRSITVVAKTAHTLRDTLPRVARTCRPHPSQCHSAFEKRIPRKAVGQGVAKKGLDASKLLRCRPNLSSVGATTTSPCAPTHPLPSLPPPSFLPCTHTAIVRHVKARDNHISNKKTSARHAPSAPSLVLGPHSSPSRPPRRPPQPDLHR